ncbi:hypothetical protein GE09DRAFT_1231576 [Coniochaeta sp. 2T2.1]|nr:hypothetical protein GE09DRAFT_1231576 [Coniochaeta sp. 2T2.1]
MASAQLQLDVVDVTARLCEMLYRCESNYQMKGVIWQLVVEDTSPVHVRTTKLYDLDIDDVRDAIVEIWFADQRALDAMEDGRSSGTPGDDPSIIRQQRYLRMLLNNVG